MNETHELLLDRVASRAANMVEAADRGTVEARRLAQLVAEAAAEACEDYRWRLGPQQQYLWLLGVAAETIYRLMGVADLADRLLRHMRGETESLDALLRGEVATVLQSVELRRGPAQCR